jgi:GT2 family glycosyltransferase
MKISIIIVNYNLTAEVSVCIESILKYSANENIEIILVDNNSDEEESKSLVEKFLNSNIPISFEYLRENRGFGSGNNAGFYKSSGDIILFLNPDAFLTSNIFPSIRKYFVENNNVGILGPKIVDQDGKQEKSFGIYPNLISEFFNIIFLKSFFENFLLKFFGRTKIYFEVDWVTGSALFIRRSKFEEVNGFDENIFMYNEEIDLCKRVSENGNKIVFYPQTELIHLQSVSSRKNYFNFTKTSYESKVYYIKKHFKGLSKLLMLKFLTLHILLLFVIWTMLLPVSPDKAKGKLKAFPILLKKIVGVE